MKVDSTRTTTNKHCSQEIAESYSEPAHFIAAYTSTTITITTITTTTMIIMYNVLSCVSV